jgi:poly(A) polymerase
MRRLAAAEHGLQKSQVDTDALHLVEQLTQAGYQGLLVGGCVRDLLLGVAPKDFDVATDATPEEVRRLFRRSRLVGRRFRIAHVRYGRKVIEVSTFRKGEAAEEDERHHADSGLILRDNVWGTQEEDAFRRDFTINALYYDPETEEIVDYVGGLDDLEHRRLRFIGDADLRLREDPVRILRAIRFVAKLGFSLDAAIEAAIPQTAAHLRAIPPARLFDEVCKLFLSGNALPAWQFLAATPLRHALFPCTPPDEPLVRLAMANTDNRIAEEKPVTPGFLLAVLLWRDYLARTAALLERHKPAEARAGAAAATLADQQQILSIPRRFSQFVRDVWTLQDRLERRQTRAVVRAFEHARFRAGYDFLSLRAETGEPLQELVDWWTRFQECDRGERDDMLQALQAEAGKRERGGRRRRRRKPRARSAPSDDDG